MSGLIHLQTAEGREFQILGSAMQAKMVEPTKSVDSGEQKEPCMTLGVVSDTIMARDTWGLFLGMLNIICKEAAAMQPLAAITTSAV